MVHCVAANLIFGGNLLNQIGVSFCYPAYYEKRCAAVSLLKYAKQALYILVDAHLVTAPLLLAACLLKIKDMEPLFDIKG